MTETLEKANIKGNPQIVQMEYIDEINVEKTYKDNYDSVLFIQFAKGEHIVVVGAGKDYVKNPIYTKPR